MTHLSRSAAARLPRPAAVECVATGRVPTSRYVVISLIRGDAGERRELLLEQAALQKRPHSSAFSSTPGSATSAGVGLFPASISRLATM